MLVGENLTWEILEMKRDSRLAIYYPGQRGDDRGTQDAEREWLLTRLLMLAPFARVLAKAFKNNPSLLLVEPE
jgi:hypothetical protein